MLDRRNWKKLNIGNAIRVRPCSLVRFSCVFLISSAMGDNHRLKTSACIYEYGNVSRLTPFWRKICYFFVFLRSHDKSSAKVTKNPFSFCRRIPLYQNVTKLCYVLRTNWNQYTCKYDVCTSVYSGTQRQKANGFFVTFALFLLCEWKNERYLPRECIFLMIHFNFVAYSTRKLVVAKTHQSYFFHHEHRTRTDTLQSIATHQVEN